MLIQQEMQVRRKNHFAKAFGTDGVEDLLI